MSYIEGTRKSPAHYVCDQSGADIPLIMPSGTLVLMEIPNGSVRTPLREWPVYHFRDLECLQSWVKDCEQVL